MALEQLREARDAVATSGLPHKPDWELGIFTTADTVGANRDPLGTIALQVPPTATAPTVWRLGDAPGGAIPAANLRSASRRV